MPSQNTSEEEGLPLRPRVRLPGETLELATPISQHPLVPSKEGSGKAETTNFQNDTQLVPRVLPKTSACQLLGWLLLPLLGPRLGRGSAPPRSPGTLGCPWAGGRGPQLFAPWMDFISHVPRQVDGCSQTVQRGFSPGSLCGWKHSSLPFSYFKTRIRDKAADMWGLYTLSLP